MKKLTNEDRLTLLKARVKRSASHNKIFKQYEYRDIYLKIDMSEVLLSDAVRALAENNEMEAEMAERFSL